MKNKTKFVFKDIPALTKVAVFNHGSKEEVMTYDAILGSSEYEFEVPSEWDNVRYRYLSKSYYIPLSSGSVDMNREYTLTGEDFYLDVSRTPFKEELNQEDLQSLIHQISSSDNLSGRQKFFVSLISLQSHFEFSIYAMLVMSNFKSKTQYENLNTQSNRIDVAFDTSNTSFFSDPIEICPGKEPIGAHLDVEIGDQIKTIFKKVNWMRNKIVHRWTFKDIGRQKIQDVFVEVGELIPYSETDDDFYKNAAWACTRLWARCDFIRHRTLLFKERDAVQKERTDRGY